MHCATTMTAWVHVEMFDEIRERVGRSHDGSQNREQDVAARGLGRVLESGSLGSGVGARQRMNRCNERLQSTPPLPCMH